MRARHSICVYIAGIAFVVAPLVAFAQKDTAVQSASYVARTTGVGEGSPWPRTVMAGATSLVLYQPQLDSWDGFRLSARVAVEATGGKPPTARYGVMTIEASTLTDKGRRVVTIDRARIVKSEFPSATAAEVRSWEQAIQLALEGKSRTLALDRLEGALSSLDTARVAAQQALRNAAPRIIFASVPAILVSIDGAPKYGRPDDGMLERVINTRVLLLRDQHGTHYLKLFDGWMSAPALAGPWNVLRAPRAELERVYQRAAQAHLVDPLSGQADAGSAAPSLARTVPAIVVASAPTELVVTDGAARYVAIAGTRLQYVENTTGNVFRSGADGKTYVLASGRWFSAPGELGPWTYVPANALPADFALIPDDSAKENVKASVAGTAQAREAAIAATVPQTAAVKVGGTAMAPPQLDGAPVFEPIAGTSLRYVANTPIAVIEVPGKQLYALQNGVWFTAPALAGPWRVATSVPAVIYAIPPESPLYYVTAVRVYGVDGDTVYVGYTPAYEGTLVDPQTGVVVYGTGYAYDPWVGDVWYGAPVTYGYGAGVAYTPWTGWAVAFGLGWAWGASTTATGWGWGPYPYWGAWCYPAWGTAYGPRGGAVSWGPHGWAGTTGNIYSQWGNRATVSRAGRGYDAWSGNKWASRVGASYNSRTGVASAGQRGAVRNVYSGDFAAGARGVAQGPGGTIAAGERGVAASPGAGVGVAGSRGTVVNPGTGQSVSGARGVAVDRGTGQATTFAGATGSGGGSVARVGNDVYAGRDGNVYRNTGSGWEQRTGGGWTPATAGAAGQADARTRQLDAERSARQAGAARTQSLNRSSMGMQRSFGGFRGGGFRGGGRRR